MDSGLAIGTLTFAEYGDAPYVKDILIDGASLVSHYPYLNSRYRNFLFAEIDVGMSEEDTISFLTLAGDKIRFGFYTNYIGVVWVEMFKKRYRNLVNKKVGFYLLNDHL